MEIKEQYLLAMREQAPKMFNEMRKTGALDAHLTAKAKEAAAMFQQISAGEPTHPNGLLKDDQRRREIEEQVRGTLIEFPPENPTPDVDGENVPQPVTRSA
jgi:hypothetical protein